MELHISLNLFKKELEADHERWYLQDQMITPFVGAAAAKRPGRE